MTLFTTMAETPHITSLPQHYRRQSVRSELIPTGIEYLINRSCFLAVMDAQEAWGKEEDNKKAQTSTAMLTRTYEVEKDVCAFFFFYFKNITILRICQLMYSRRKSAVVCIPYVVVGGDRHGG